MICLTIWNASVVPLLASIGHKVVGYRLSEFRHRLNICQLCILISEYAPISKGGLNRLVNLHRRMSEPSGTFVAGQSPPKNLLAKNMSSLILPCCSRHFSGILSADFL
jgi:hypothetical protein